MRLVRYNGSKLGLLSEEGAGVIDLTERLDLTSADPLQEFLERDLNATEYIGAKADFSLDEVSLYPPLRRPGKIVAAAGNYLEHMGEVDDKYVHPNQRVSEKELRLFIKAPSSITGPDQQIELPYADRRSDHEIELAFIMGSDVKDGDLKTIEEHIFGYTILLDISIRGKEDRSHRKSYDTFTPMGPVVVTSDEIDDPHDLAMELQVNGETRQQSNTRFMRYTCAEIAHRVSVGTTLEVGDVIATGTPSGVGRLRDGDTVVAEIENIGEMSLDVREHTRTFEDVSS